jgi:hypothetical protein
MRAPKRETRLQMIEAAAGPEGSFLILRQL